MNRFQAQGYHLSYDRFSCRGIVSCTTTCWLYVLQRFKRRMANCIVHRCQTSLTVHLLNMLQAEVEERCESVCQIPTDCPRCSCGIDLLSVMCMPSPNSSHISLRLLQRFSAVLSHLGVSRSHGIAVALSGGSDSMALAMLASWWRDARGARWLRPPSSARRSSVPGARNDRCRPACRP